MTPEERKRAQGRAQDVVRCREIDANVQAMCPAAPGTYALKFEDGEVSRNNVVAWVVAGSGGFLIPMSGSSGWVSEAQGDDPAILFPDGSVESYCGRWETEAAWVEWCRAKA